MPAVRRSGAAFTQVLVISLVLLAAATAVIRWQLQRHRAAANNLRNSQLKGDVESLRAPLMACLARTGYPSGSCTPNAAQAACVPAGAAVIFGGTPPACSLTITATR